MRRCLELLLGTIILATLLHTFAVMGLVAPVRVSAGSMAPHLRGPHWLLACHRCGAEYPVGTDATPQAGRTICPQCGSVVLVHAAPRRDGDALVVHRRAFLFRPPQRWETVVFRCPENATRLCVKRVVGLPGERISLRGGNVYVDGRLARKSLAEQHVLKVLVHREAARASRWQAVEEQSGWHSQSRGASMSWVYAATATAELSGPDFLAYQAPHDAPTTDYLPYNAGVPAAANLTSDLMLTGRIRLAAGGCLLLVCGDDGDALSAEWDLAEEALRLWRADRLLVEVECPLRPDMRDPDGFVEVELSLIDQQILVALDGRPRARYALAAPIRPGKRPFAIAARKGTLAAEDLAIWRDVVYTPRPGGTVASNLSDATWQLAEDEYFVLGDNPAVSADSRTWPHGPGLAGKWVAGRPMGVR